MPEENGHKVVVELLYTKLMDSANRFLHNAKNYSINVLKLENPTYAEIAKQMREVAAIITVLAENVNDPMIGPKAFEYVTLMDGIAKAIDTLDDVALQDFVSQLDRRPFL